MVHYLQKLNFQSLRLIRILPYLIGCLLLLTSANLLAQSSITGKVIDDITNEPIPGVAIVVKGTTKGTVTGIDGNYSIEAGQDDVLVFSFVGFKTVEIPVGSQTVIDVSLEEDVTSLEEVVVVGYGTQKKSDVTGAVTSVDNEAIKEVPVANVGEALQGRAAGVTIQNTSSVPGQAPQIRIRGNRSLSASNSPLLVVDGIPFDGSINDINPNIIESINILKDASSTAIYGSRGSNGVIIITTNRGKAGKTQISYNGYQGIRTVARQYDLFNAEEYLEMRETSGYIASFTPTELESIELGRSTDWQDLLYQDGTLSDHQVSVSGGSETTQFSFSGGYHNETSVLPGQRFKRYSLQNSIDHQFGKVLKVGLNTINSLSYIEGVTTYQGRGLGPLYSALMLSPLAVPYNPDGSLKIYPLEPSNTTTVNPLTLLNDDGSWVDESRRLRTFNSLYAEVNILDNLKYRLNVGLDYSQEKNGSYFGSPTAVNSSGISNAGVVNGEASNYTIENILTYDRTFREKHSLNFTGLYSIQQYESSSSEINVQDLPSDQLQYYNFGLARVIESTTGDYIKWGLLSYMGRINYNYDDRYLLTLTARADGSSRLAKGNKWNFYPAIGAGWNITNERFWDNDSFINNLKLRISYGQTSNTSINPYQTLGGLSRAPYNFGSTNLYGFYLTTLTNPDLGWEYTKTINIGVDFGFLNDRINGSLEVYQQRTNNILLNKGLPPTAGVNSFLLNAGKTQNRGIELSLSSVNISKTNAFSWSTDLNFFLNREKLVSLADPVMDRDVGNLWFVGEPLTVIYDYKKIGIWQLNEETEASSYGQKPGEIKVEDLNDDGQITSTDRQIIGSSQPKWEGGITNRFTYKGFDLSIVAYARVGGTLVSALHQPASYLNMLQGGRNGIKVNYWTPENPTNDYPKPDFLRENPLYGSTLGYFDATYLKIRSINFGYNLPQNIADKISASRLRVYFTVQNPFTLFSPYVDEGGLDPEGNSVGFSDTQAVPSRAITVGINTPPTRAFLLGLNLSF